MYNLNNFYKEKPTSISALLSKNIVAICKYVLMNTEEQNVNSVKGYPERKLTNLFFDKESSIYFAHKFIYLYYGK